MPPPSAIVLALVPPLLLAAAAPSAAPCPRGVHLAGDPGLVARLAPMLAERGLASAPGAACGTLTAAVELAPGGIRVRVEDPEGRSGERTVGRVEVAAAVLESWARSDLAAPLLAREAPPLGPRALQAEPVAEPVAGTRAARTTPAEERLSAPGPVGEVAAAAELSVPTVGAVGLGARVGACARFGALCLGLLGRSVSSGGAGEPAPGEPTVLGRTELALLLFAALPRTLGGATVSPGAGFGAAAVWTSLDDRGERLSVDSYGLRAELSCAVGFPLGDGVAALAGIAAGTSIGESTASAAVADVVLANEPRLQARAFAGIGLGP